MNHSLNNFQKYLFILLIYSSGFSAYLWDVMGKVSRTMLYVTFDVLILALAILSFSYLRGRLLTIILFIIIGVVMNMTYTEASTYSSMNGAREIIMILGILIFLNKIFAPGNEELVEEYIGIMKTFGFIFLLANVPIAIKQYLVNGPTDAVGGSYGYGGSGVLTLTVICLVYFMQQFYGKKFIPSAILFLTMIPLLLNETKVSFVLIPAMVFVLKVKPKLSTFLMAIAGAVVFFLIFNQFFEATFLDFDNSAEGIFSSDFLSGYLAGDISEYDDIPRFTKIILAWHLLTEHTNTLFFGYEFGIFRGGNTVEMSHFAIENQWMLFGTRPYLFFLMIQGGLFLVGGIFFLVFHVNKFFRSTNKFQVFLFALFLLILFYNDALRFHAFVTIYFFLVYYSTSPSYKRLVEGEKEEAAELSTEEINQLVNS
ncbi:MAG TPA: hypothetical protein VK628_02620 [Flavitalea sp.]|nr:hypothetical protein [Flavitalea sp.]